MKHETPVSHLNRNLVASTYICTYNVMITVLARCILLIANLVGVLPIYTVLWFANNLLFLY